MSEADVNECQRERYQQCLGWDHSGLKPQWIRNMGLAGKEGLGMTTVCGGRKA